MGIVCFSGKLRKLEEIFYFFKNDFENLALLMTCLEV